MQIRRYIPWVLAVLVLASQPAVGQQWVRSLTLTEQGADWTCQVRFGVWPGATDGLDPQLGEVELPPLPPMGVPQAMFTGPGFENGLLMDLRGSSTTVENKLTLYFQRPGVANGLITWDPAAIAAATTSAHLRDPFGGVLVNVDMAAVGQVVLANAALRQLELSFVSRDLFEGSFPTKLEIVSPASGSVIDSGRPMPQVVVRALTDGGELAEDFSGTVTLSTGTTAGQLQGTLQAAAVAGVARFDDVIYTATADGQPFTLRAASSPLRGGDAALIADVDATRLTVRTAPNPVYVGQTWVPALTVAAVDAAGVVDRDFAEVVTVGLTQGAGSLVGELSRSATLGQVEFPLVYQTTATEAQITVAADDQAAVGSDLAPVTQQLVVQPASVATQLWIASPVTGSTVTSGTAMPPVVVRALTDQGQLADRFTGVVTLSTPTTGGQLQGGLQVAAVGGVARFDNVTYTAGADAQGFVLHASSGALRIGVANLVADVLATRLRFVEYGVPAQVIDGLVVPPPLVVAQDANGAVDLDFGGQVTLSLESGLGRLAGTLSLAAVDGTARYLDVTYAAAERELQMSLRAAAASGGLTPAISTTYLVRQPHVTATTDDAGIPTPTAFALAGAFPNPFNPATQIAFDLPEAALVTVDVYDLLGRHVGAVGPAAVPAGASRRIALDGEGLASGAYVYRLTAAGSSRQWEATGKLLLLR